MANQNDAREVKNKTYAICTDFDPWFPKPCNESLKKVKEYERSGNLDEVLSISMKYGISLSENFTKLREAQNQERERKALQEIRENLRAKDCPKAAITLENLSFALNPYVRFTAGAEPLVKEAHKICMEKFLGDAKSGSLKIENRYRAIGLVKVFSEITGLLEPEETKQVEKLLDGLLIEKHLKEIRVALKNKDCSGAAYSFVEIDARKEKNRIAVPEFDYLKNSILDVCFNYAKRELKNLKNSKNFLHDYQVVLDNFLVFRFIEEAMPNDILSIYEQYHEKETGLEVDEMFENIEENKYRGYTIVLYISSAKDRAKGYPALEKKVLDFEKKARNRCLNENLERAKNNIKEKDYYSIPHSLEDAAECFEESNIKWESLKEVIELKKEMYSKCEDILRSVDENLKKANMHCSFYDVYNNLANECSANAGVALSAEFHELRKQAHEGCTNAYFNFAKKEFTNSECGRTISLLRHIKKDMQTANITPSAEFEGFEKQVYLICIPAQIKFIQDANQQLYCSAAENAIEELKINLSNAGLENKPLQDLNQGLNKCLEQKTIKNKLPWDILMNF